MNFRRASNNSAVKLGKELGRGGEGAVFLVNGAPDLVAKVYLKPPSAARIDKLRSMARGASPDLLKVAAWPTELLLDEGGQPRGFLMPRVNGREDLHQLYTPKSRRRIFPKADFRFLIRVAANLARALAQIHARGHVIGDVNHGNALVGTDGTVRLIDCDSFQIRDGGRVYTCDVGVPLFTPRELSGRAFRGLRRSADHDAFGLAVLIFHLLYLGRHPFAGQFADGDMPIERAIAEGRVAYGSRAGEMGMTAPPGTIPFGAFGSEIELLFESAFASTGQRPTAQGWVTALRRLETSLVVCRGDLTHYHPEARACCWCVYEKHWNTRIFGQALSQYIAAGVPKVARLWDAITAIRKPEPVFALEVPPEIDSSTATQAFKMILRPFRSRRAIERDASIEGCQQQLARRIRDWNVLAGDDRVGELYRDLERAKNRLLRMPPERKARIDAHEGNLEALQREVWLARHSINEVKIPFISKADVVLLESFGIDSADDVIRNAGSLPPLQLPEAHSHLRAWARSIERGFEPEASPSLKEALIQKIDEEMAAEQEELMRILAKGASRLRSLIHDVEEERKDLRQKVSDARTRLRLAETE